MCVCSIFMYCIRYVIIPRTPTFVPNFGVLTVNTTMYNKTISNTIILQNEILSKISEITTPNFFFWTILKMSKIDYIDPVSPKKNRCDWDAVEGIFVFSK